MTLFVTKGDAPLTPEQLEKRAQKYIKRSWPDQAREKSIRASDGAFDAFMSTFSTNHTTNVTNNTFNWQLQEYGSAVARLARYIVADGRDEVTEELGTGAYDDDGNEVTETIVTVSAVDPVEATVDVTTYDDEGEATVETIENPLITTDVAERAAAQAVVDGTPQAVVEAA
jgi:hypothetical protein